MKRSVSTFSREPRQELIVKRYLVRECISRVISPERPLTLDFSKEQLQQVNARLFLVNEKERYKPVTVFYATDRRAVRTPDHYGSERALDGRLSLGVVKVGMPASHKAGALESPSILSLYGEDPEKHVVLRSMRRLAPRAFFKNLRKRLAAFSRKQILVFIHGFNVTFKEGARRAAQLSHDLSFAGIPILYSWPSSERLSKRSYLRDETNIEWTIPHLKKFLHEVVYKSGATDVHLIAHSVGNRALTKALDSLADETRGMVKFRQVVLTAPDVDAGAFRELVDKILGIATRITLYVSSNDLALKKSRKWHGWPRAGESERKNLIVLPGVDTIDASSVDTSFSGHSYYGDSPSFLSDLHYLLNGVPPRKRWTLMPKRFAGNLIYWSFRPVRRAKPFFGSLDFARPLLA